MTQVKVAMEETPRAAAFAHACWQLSAIEETISDPTIMHARFEDLLRDYDADCQLLTHLTGGRLDRWPTDAHAELDALRDERVGRHTGEQRTPQQVYQDWPDWKRDIFATLVSARAIDAFAGLGYDIDFIASQRNPQVTFDQLRGRLAASNARTLASRQGGPGLIIGLGQTFETTLETGALDDLVARGVTIDAADDDPRRRARFADRFRAVTPIDDVDPSKYAWVHIAAILDGERLLKRRVPTNG